MNTNLIRPSGHWFRPLSFSTLVVGLLFCPAFGAINTYQGVDSTATNKTQLVNSLTAQSNVASAVASGLVVQTFESKTPAGNQPTWTAGSLTYERVHGDGSGFANAPSTGRFATSGNVYAYSNGDVSVLKFGANIDAFGAFFTDVGDYGSNLRITFNDGSDQYILLPETSNVDAGGMFFGFTDFGASISEIRILNLPSTTTVSTMFNGTLYRSPHQLHSICQPLVYSR